MLKYPSTINGGDCNENAVIGMGYVGLTTSAILVHIEHDLYCVEIDEDKLEMLKGGNSPIYE